MKFRSVLAVLAAGLFFAQSAPASEPALDQDAIAYRKHIMVSLEAQFEAIASIVAFDGPPENLASHLQTALMISRMVLPSFEKHAPGGSSQDHLWDNWSDYQAHMREFEAAVAMAVEAAKFGTVTDVVWYTDQVSCRKCHELYRQAPVRGREDYFGY
jgi:cytochrome c556